MPQYQSAGQIPHKRHTQFELDGGKMAYEEMFTLHGFSDIYSLLYHHSAPTELVEMSDSRAYDVAEWDPECYRHHLLDTENVAGEGSYLEARRVLLFNDDLSIAAAAPDRDDDHFYRNGLSDELICVGAGHGELHSPFGILEYGPGDMVVVPRGTTQAWHPAPGSRHRLFIVESRTTITPPSRFLARLGQFSFKSPVSERDVRTPVLPAPVKERGRFKITVKMGDQLTDYFYANHPFDVIGWDGYLYPYAINMRDYEPVTRRIHTMPDEQQIFETGGAAICCLVPRPLDYHPIAIPAPPFHSSIDVDEVILNMGDVFMGWTRPAMGVITYHPRGIIHGSKPGGYFGSIGMKEFDGKAIMVDVEKPLRMTRFAQQCDDPSYPLTWSKNPNQHTD